VVDVESCAMPVGAWREGPARPRLGRSAIHLWHANLDDVEDSLHALLSTDERARAETILGSLQRRRWISSRAVLRALLARYLDCEPSQPSLAIGAHGKPALARLSPQRLGASSAQLEFNLSHAADIALYGFAASQPLGVDVEYVRPSIDHRAVARRALGGRPAAALAMLEPAARGLEFARLWTRHEARVKCIGSGLGGADAPEPPTWILDEELGNGREAVVALAAGSEPAELECWRWPARGSRRR
jgi:4'-phosphopantetheinyl transferase